MAAALVYALDHLCSTGGQTKRVILALATAVEEAKVKNQQSLHSPAVEAAATGRQQKRGRPGNNDASAPNTRPRAAKESCATALDSLAVAAAAGASAEVGTDVDLTEKVRSTFGRVLDSLSGAGAFPDAVLDSARADLEAAGFKAYKDTSKGEGQKRLWRNKVQLPGMEEVEGLGCGLATLLVKHGAAMPNLGEADVEAVIAAVHGNLEDRKPFEERLKKALEKADL